MFVPSHVALQSVHHRGKRGGVFPACIYSGFDRRSGGVIRIPDGHRSDRRPEAEINALHVDGRLSFQIINPKFRLKFDEF